MAKEVINIDGQDTVVREDTAKAFRGVHWALFSIGAFILIAALMFFGGFAKLFSDGDIDRASPTVDRNAGN